MIVVAAVTVCELSGPVLTKIALSGAKETVRNEVSSCRWNPVAPDP